MSVDELHITTISDRKLTEAKRDAAEIPREAAALAAMGERRCTRRVKLRPDMRQRPGPGNEYFRNEDGTIKTRPCEKPPIKGGTVCASHGGSVKSIRNRANKRLLAMVEPSLIELNEIVHQNEHMPAKLGAIRTVLERAGEKALGALNKDTGQDTRPIINIGIKVGGIDKPTANVKVGILEASPHITTDET